jgi:hypothetical protein
MCEIKRPMVKIKKLGARGFEITRTPKKKKQNPMLMKSTQS